VSQPPALNRAFSFSNFQAANPSLPIPGSQVDLELNNVVATANAIRTNLALIQRDDGALANASVTYDALSPALQTAGLAPALPWVASTAYAMNVSVTHGSAFYRSLVAHTSGAFATDLAAGKWILIVDFSTIALVAAAMIGVTPSGSLTTNVQTSLQALDTGKAPLSHTQLSSTISDSTAVGRALLTAADVPTQQNLLGFTVLGFQPGNIKETAGIVLEPGWYYCDGSNKNRVTDANLFNAITISLNCNVTAGSPIVTGLSDTSNLSPGMPVSSPGTQLFIKSVDSGSQITLSGNNGATGGTTLIFMPYGAGDGTSTFGIPNRVYLGVGRDNASGSAANITQVSTTISTVGGSSGTTVASAAGLFVGMYVSTANLPIGSQIVAISGTNVQFNVGASATAGTTVARFSPLVDAQTLGATGGAISQTTTLATANLPAYTPSGTIANGAITSTVTGGTLGGQLSGSSTGTGSGTPLQPAAITVTSTQATSTFTGAAQGGSSTPIVKSATQPTIVMNYIIKR
jgi:hypothetical protein